MNLTCDLSFKGHYYCLVMGLKGAKDWVGNTTNIRLSVELLNWDEMTASMTLLLFFFHYFLSSILNLIDCSSHSFLFSFLLFLFCYTLCPNWTSVPIGTNMVCLQYFTITCIWPPATRWIGGPLTVKGKRTVVSVVSMNRCNDNTSYWHTNKFVWKSENEWVVTFTFTFTFVCFARVLCSCHCLELGQ